MKLVNSFFFLLSLPYLATIAITPPQTTIQNLNNSYNTLIIVNIAA